MLLLSMVLIPVVSAQTENNYTITVEEAFKHANAHMEYFAAANITDFGDWKGASIDAKLLELYDINGKKLYYQFSVYTNNIVSNHGLLDLQQYSESYGSEAHRVYVRS